MKLLNLARVGLLAAAVLSPHAASAAGEVTTYTVGDLFIGFRQSGVANTLAVDIGQASQFIPTSITGGTWDGNPFNVTFGLIPVGEPGAGTTVTNLSADLTNTFGSTWAANDPLNSSLDVSWAVVGSTNKLSANIPINGLAKRSVFLTVPRTDPSTVATAPSNFDNSNSGAAIDSFAQGAIGNAYKGRISSIYSNKAYTGPATDGNNWGTAIGPIGSTFNSGVLGEQPLSGPNSGPTNSVLDLYLFPNTGSTLVTTPTYLGSFSLNSSGQLLYQAQAVPEPGTFALFGAGAVLVGYTVRRKRFKDRSIL